MKFQPLFSAFVAGASLFAVTHLTASAQDGVQVEVGPGGVRVEAPGKRTAVGADVAGRVRAKFATHRAKSVVGLTVKNRAGEDLGKVEDLVIDDRGLVRYAAVSYGGFLGFNDKLFAVPYSSFSFKSDKNGALSHAELNVDKKILENAPGFPKDSWPDFGDDTMNKSIEEFYLKAGDARVQLLK